MRSIVSGALPPRSRKAVAFAAVLILAAVLLCVSPSGDGGEAEADLGDNQHSRFFNHDGSVITGLKSDPKLMEEFRGIYTVYMPTEIDGVEMTEIAPRAFLGGMEGSHEVYMPSTVTTIGEEAFMKCSAILFRGNYALTIGDRAFAGAGYLYGAFPETVTVGDSCFAGAKFYGSGLYAPKLEYIGNDAFRDSMGLSGDIDIPSIRHIGCNAFDFEMEITGFNIGPDLDFVDPDAFTGVNGDVQPIFDGFHGYEKVNMKYAIAGRAYTVLPDLLFSFYSEENEVYKETAYLNMVGGMVVGTHHQHDKLGVVTIPEMYGTQTFRGFDHEAFTWGQPTMERLILPDMPLIMGDRSLCGLNTPYISTGTAKDHVDLSNVFYIGEELMKDNKVLSGDVLLDSEVKKIYPRSFAGATSITGIRLLGTVSDIGEGAFAGCTGLRDVFMENGIRTIGDRAFAGCTSIDRVNIPVTVTAIGNGAFSGCTGLESFDMGDSLPTVGTGLLAECASMRTVNLGRVQDIPARTCIGCKSLQTVISDLPFVKIGDMAFKGCVRVPTVDLNSVVSVGEQAFDGCTALSFMAEMPSATAVGPAAFRGCTSLGGAAFSADLGKIASDAFDDCGGPGVKAAFDGMSADEKVDGRYYVAGKSFFRYSLVPGDFRSLQNLQYDFFEYHNGVIVGLSGPLPEGTNILYIPDFAEGRKVTGIGPDALRATQDSYPLKDVRKVILPGGSDRYFTIGGGAFMSCTDLESVTVTGSTEDFCIPSVKSLGAQAFSGCSGLRGSVDVDIEMGESAFSGCSSLESVRVYVQDMPGRLFHNCSGITSVEFADTVRSVGERTFCNCSGLAGTLVIPDSVASLGIGSFEGCSSVTDISFGNGLHEIGERVFAGCTGLQKLVPGPEIATLKAYSFGDCAIGEIDLTGSVHLVSVDPDAFSYIPGSGETFPSATFDGMPLSVMGPNRSAEMLKGFVYSLTDSPDPSFAAYSSGQALVSVEGNNVEYRFPDGTSETRTFDGTEYFRFDPGAGVSVSPVNTTVMTIAEAVFTAEPGNVWYCDGSTFTDIRLVPGMMFSASEYTPKGAFEWEFRGDGAYLKKYNGRDVSVAVPATVAESGREFAVVGIMAGSFADRADLSRVVLPSSVRTLEDAFASQKGAFEGCSTMKSVLYVPASEAYIGDRAFFGCSSLEAFPLSDRMTHIGDLAFAGAMQTGRDVTLQPGMYVGQNAFSDCVIGILTVNGGDFAGKTFEGTQFGSIVTGPSFADIPGHLFEGASFLTPHGLELAGSVVSVGESAFSGFSGMTSLTVPASVTSISARAFADCNLESISMEAAGFLEEVSRTAFSKGSSDAVFDGVMLADSAAANALLVRGYSYVPAPEGIPSYTSGSDAVRLTAGDSPVRRDSGSISPGDTLVMRFQEPVPVTVDDTRQVLDIGGERFAITGSEAWFPYGSDVPFPGGSTDGGLDLYAMLCMVTFAAEGNGSVPEGAGYAYGTEVSMYYKDPLVIIGDDRYTAVPDRGFAFLNWTPVIDEVTGHVTLTAHFESAIVDIRVVCGVGGHITMPGGEITTGESRVFHVEERTPYHTDGGRLVIGDMVFTAHADGDFSHPAWDLPGSGTVSSGDEFRSMYATTMIVEAGDYGSVVGEGMYYVYAGTYVSSEGPELIFNDIYGRQTAVAQPMSGYSFSMWTFDPDFRTLVSPTVVTAVFGEGDEPSPIPGEDPDGLVPGIYHNPDGSITIVKKLDDGTYLRVTYFEDLHWIFKEHFSAKGGFLGSVETTMDRQAVGEDSAAIDLTEMKLYRTGATEIRTLKVYTDESESLAVAQVDARKVPGMYTSVRYDVSFAADTLKKFFGGYTDRSVDVRAPVSVNGGLTVSVGEDSLMCLKRTGFGLTVSGTDCWFSLSPADTLLLDGELTVVLEYVPEESLTERQAEAAGGYLVYSADLDAGGVPLKVFRGEASLGLPFPYTDAGCRSYRMAEDGSLTELETAGAAGVHAVISHTDRTGLFFAEPVYEPAPQPEGTDIATVIGATVLLAGLAMLGTLAVIKLFGTRKQ